MTSIIERLATKDFSRLRLGVGQKKESFIDLADYVLSRFSQHEKKIVKEKVLDLTTDVIQTWIDSGVDQCMNRFNKKQKQT